MATALKISAAQFLPERKTLATLREAAAHCKGCPLYQRARTVFGEGLKRARLMLVGEQPGNEEDRRREVRWFIADLERVAEGLKKEAA